MITLWARAVETTQPNPILFDRKAVEIVDKIDYNFDKFSSARDSQVGVCIRGYVIDQWLRQFLSNNASATVVEIGAGLDTRFERLDNMTLRWFDLDLPDSVAVRKLFFAESDRRKFISGSVLEPDWINTVKAASAGPFFFIGEGVLMYFTDEQVKTLFAMLAEHFPGSLFAFDAMSPFMVKNQKTHDALQHTSAFVKWGLKDVKEIETWNEQYKIEKSLYFSNFPQYLKRFSLKSRLLTNHFLVKLVPSLRHIYGMHLVKLG